MTIEVSNLGSNVTPAATDFLVAVASQAVSGVPAQLTQVSRYFDLGYLAQTALGTIALSSSDTVAVAHSGTVYLTTIGSMLSAGGAGAPWQITDGTHTVTGVIDLILGTGASIASSGTGTATLNVAVPPQLQLTDGTHTVTAVSDIILTTGGSLAGSGTGTATIDFAGSTSPWQITDGTRTVTGVTDLIIAGGGGTLAGSGTGTATLDIGGGGGSITVEDGTHTVTATSVFALSNGLTLASSGTGTATLGVNSGPGDGFPVILHGYSGDGTLAVSGTCLVADPPAGYTYSFGTSCLSIKVGSAPTNNVTLTLANGGSTVGSVVVPASSTTPTITITGAFNVTSEILLSGPATPDATFGKVRSTMIGTR